MQLSKRFKRSAVILAAVAAMTVSGRVASAQAVAQLPEESLVILKVANIGATSTKIANFAQQLGLQAFQPDLADPLAWFQRETKFQNGLDKAGEIAFAYVDPASVGGDKDKSLVFLIPVSDYAAFLTNFPDAKTEGGISQVTMKPGNDIGFVANWGAYAALSPSKELVGKKPAGVTPSKLAGQELDGKDFVLFANLPKLRTALLPEVAKLRDKAAAEVETKLNEKPEAKVYIPAAKVAVGQAIGILEAFLRDSDAATISANIGTEGLSFTVLSDFQPTSYLGKAMAGVVNSDKSYLAGLPDTKYLFFGGGSASPKVQKAIVNDVVGPVVTELKKIEGPEAAKAKTVIDYIDGLNTFADSTEGAAFGVLQPTGALGADPIIQYVTLIHGDSAAIKESYVKTMQASNEISKLAAGGGFKDVTTTVTPAAKTVDGISFDQYKVVTEFDETKPEANQMKMAMQFMYGPEGMTVYSAPVDAKNVLVVFGLKDDVISSVIKSAKSGENALGNIEGVKSVAAQLPEKRSFEAYIPLDNIVSAAVGYAQQSGMPVKFQLPPELPPIGFSAGTEGSAIRSDLYIPTQLISSLVSAGLQAAAGAQGGGAPQGGGGGL